MTAAPSPSSSGTSAAFEDACHAEGMERGSYAVQAAVRAFRRWQDSSPTPQIAGGVRGALATRVAYYDNLIAQIIADEALTETARASLIAGCESSKSAIQLFAEDLRRLSPQAQAGETQRCDRCGSSGDTYVLCSGCGALAQAAPISADPRDARKGWRLSYDWLQTLQREVETTGEHVSLEAIEEIVLRASPPAALPATEEGFYPTHGALLAEINKAAHAAGTNAWVREVLKQAHRAIRRSAPIPSTDRVVPHEDCLNCRCAPDERCKP